MIKIPEDEPLSPAVVRRLARHIFRSGITRFSPHARKRMKDHDLRMHDCERVLLSGWALPGEWEHGSWRYQLRTHDVTVVVAFRSVHELVVVTAWRN